MMLCFYSGLMREDNFPQIWVPSPENRDLRQLLWHRHRLVQMRTRIMNQLQALAMNEGYGWKKKLFSEQGRALRHTGIEPVGLISKCLEDLLSFGEGLKQTEDLTILAVRRAE